MNACFIHTYIYTYIYTHIHNSGLAKKWMHVSYTHTFSTHTYIHTHIHNSGLAKKWAHLSYIHTFSPHTYIHAYMHTHTHTQQPTPQEMSIFHTDIHIHIHTHTNSGPPKKWTHISCWNERLCVWKCKRRRSWLYRYGGKGLRERMSENWKVKSICMISNYSLNR
jgi:hypothetical protein